MPERVRAWLSAAVLCVLLALSLYLFCPWHVRPAQGAADCVFFPLEQSVGLQAACLTLLPSAITFAHMPLTGEVETPRTEVWRRPTLRAPPASSHSTAVI